MTMAQRRMPGEVRFSLNSLRDGLAAMARVRMRATMAFKAPVRSLPEGIAARVDSYSCARSIIFRRMDWVRLSRAGWSVSEEMRVSTRAAARA